MQINLFAVENQRRKLDMLGDSLVKMKNVINWEMFREILTRHLRLFDYSKGGRPPWDVVLMFKIIMLQQWYNLSDEAVEYQIVDRASFQRFLEIELGGRVPDKNTIWDFKEAISKTGIERELFDLFNKELEDSGIITKKGSIIDASFVETPKRHTTKKDDEALKNGKLPMDLLHEAQDRADEGDAANPHNIVNQHDLDARWAKKGNDSYFGYKDHIKCDRESKIITDFVVTDASVHDSQVLDRFTFDPDEVLDLDAGYVGEERVNRIKDKNRNEQTGETLEVNVCSKAQRNKPLTEQQKLANQEIARRRCRIEHIFGYIARFMGGLTIRTKGIIRAHREIAHKNLAYNLKRFVFMTG